MVYHRLGECEEMGGAPTPLLILTGWLPKLDASSDVPRAKPYRRSTFTICHGDPGLGVYDDTKADEVAALRLRFVLLGEGFPAGAKVVGAAGRLVSSFRSQT